MKKVTLFLFLFFTISAQANSISFERKKITKAMNEEVLAEFKQAMTKVFGAGKFVMDAVDSKKRNDGGRDVSATISLFGKGDVELSGGYKSKRIESFEVEFPEEATIDFNLINQLADNKLKDYLPSSFPLEAGVWVKNLAIKFGATSYIPSKLSGTINSPSSWEPIGVGSFKTEGVEFNMEVENPKLASRVVTGTISAIAKLGEIDLDLSSSISTNPDNNAISASIENLHLKNLMDALLSGDATSFVNLIPDVFKELELNKGTINIIPFEKELKMTAESSVGNVLFDFKSKTGGNKIILAMSPPTSFKFSSLSDMLKPLDDMKMEGSHFVISNKQTIIESKFINPTLDDAKFNVKKGLNLLTNIELPKDISDVLKVKNVTLVGSIPNTFNSISLFGKLAFEGLEIGDGAFSFDEVGAGLKLNVTGGIEMRFEGAGSFKTGDGPKDRVQIFGGIIAAVSPTGSVLELECGLAAGDRRAEAPADCLVEQPEWTEPFGIPGVGIRALGIRGGIGTTFPYINVIGLGGNLRLGSVRDKSKHICGSLVGNLNIADLTRTMLVAEVKNITPLALIEAFSEDVNITGDLRDALNTGIESAKLKVVLKEMELFGRTYTPGIALDSARLTLAGIKGMIGFSFGETGIAAYGEMDPYELKSGNTTLFAIRGAKPNADGSISGPSVSLGLNATDPHFKLNAAVEVLGIEASAFVLVNKDGFELDVEGNVLDGALKANIHVKVGEITPTSGVYVKASFENRLQTMVADELLKFIENESKESQKAYKDAKQVLKNAESDDPFQQAFVDLASSTVDAFAEMDRGMAVAGSYVVEGLLKDALNIRKISFEGEVTSMKGKVEVEIDMTIAGSELKEKVKMELNISEDAFGDIIISVIGDDVIDFFGTLDNEIANAFEDLGEELATAFEDLGGYIVEGAEIVGKEIVKGAEVVGEGVVVAAEYMAKAFEDFGKELENVFIGNSYTPPVSNGTPTKTPYNYTHFTVTVNKITTTDDEGIGSDGLELYGGILVKVSNNMMSNRGATPFAYGKSMRNRSDDTEEGQSINVYNKKDFYIKNTDIDAGRGWIQIISKVLEWNTNVDYDYLPGSKVINIRDLKQGGIINGSFKGFEDRGDDEEIKISYTVKFIQRMGPPPPPPSKDQIFAAVRYNKIAEIDNLQRKGGKIKQDGIIEEAIKAKVTPAMVSRLFKAGNMAKASHLELATQPQNRNPAMIDLLLRTGVRPNSNALLNEVATGKIANADKLIKKKAVPQLKHVQKAIAMNNKDMIYYLMSKSNVHIGLNELKYAVDKNDPKMVDLFIKHGAPANSAMISTAIKNGNSAMLDKLLHITAGDNSNLDAAADKNDAMMYKTLTDNRVRATGNSSIKKAIDKNNMKIVKLGLENGGYSIEVLRYAISKNNKSAMTLALENGAFGSPALNYAVNKNDLSFYTDLLTKYKASSNQALSLSYKKNNIKMGEVALKNKAYANTFIDSASKQGKADWVKLLLANKATPQNGLRSAVNYKHTEIVGLLLDAGATSNSPQHIKTAVTNKNLPMTKLLVEKGRANPDQGREIAINTNQLETTKYLLGKGAKATGLKTPSQKGWTPMVKLLVDNGADPNEGLEHSTNFNKSDISLFLLDKGAVPKDYIKYSAYHGNIPVTKKLLEKGAKPDDGNYNAVWREKPEILKLLIDAGSNVSSYKLMNAAVDHYNESLIRLLLLNKGNTAYVTPRKKNTFLHRVAEKKGKENLVKLFVDAKMNLESKNKWGETPLHLAVRSGRKNVESVRTLITAGADVNAKTNKGRSVLKRCNNKPSAKLLREAGAVKK